LSLPELKQLGGSDVVAVNQCSGNSRGFFTPRVNGGQLGNGAMGNARWAGVPLKRVLEKAGVKPGSVQVAFNGMDTPPIAGGPDFAKALELDHAMDGEVMLAWQMNGADLPVLNGYPLRLVVPGYYGTYWVKHVNDIQVTDKPFDGFWMKSAYRIPDDPCACVPPQTAPARTTPIKRFNVRSFITSPASGQQVKAGRDLLVRGIAFDGGAGIVEVALSADGGKTWQSTRLGQDLGRYAFREWSATLKAPRKGPFELMVRAVNRIGNSQPMTPLWNPPGYMRNVVETTRLVAV
jgi:DMSO/TMAO reductase YedYZ molybdopterin-dependent catalytic subunit